MWRGNVYLKLGSLLICSAAVALGQSGATVGVWELLHPVPPKALEIVNRAFRDASSGAIAGVTALRRSLADPKIAPYALKAMGVMHFDAGQVQTAVTELRDAVRLLPWDPQAQAFLSFALFTAGDIQAAEQEARRALGKNSGDPTANVTIALITVQRIRDDGGTAHDILASEVPSRLRVAGGIYPGVWLILWSLYRDSGQLDAAERVMSSYRAFETLQPPEVRRRNEQWLEARNAQYVARSAAGQGTP